MGSGLQRLFGGRGHGRRHCRRQRCCRQAPEAAAAAAAGRRGSQGERPPILLRAPLLLFCFRPGNQACAVAAQGPHISQQAVLHCASAQATPSGFRGAFPGPLGKPHAPAAHWASSGATASRPQSANSSAVAKSILDWNRQMHPLVKERECRKRCCRLLATGHALAQLEVLAQTDLLAGLTLRADVWTGMGLCRSVHRLRSEHHQRTYRQPGPDPALGPSCPRSSGAASRRTAPRGCWRSGRAGLGRGR